MRMQSHHSCVGSPATNINLLTCILHLQRPHFPFRNLTSRFLWHIWFRMNIVKQHSWVCNKNTYLYVEIILNLSRKLIKLKCHLRISLIYCDSHIIFSLQSLFNPVISFKYFKSQPKKIHLITINSSSI